MKKVLAEAIAGIIPHKMTRNQWRGILRYGLFRAVKLRRKIARNHTEPQQYLAICVIAKDEGPYLKEWIDWHLSIGVEHFYFYDNGSRDETAAVLNPYIKGHIVDYQYWPGKRRQLAAYDDCLERHRFASRWIAFIDIDEFIIPVKPPSLVGYLKSMEAFAAVEVNWLIYGSSGHKDRTDQPVMQRFKRHASASHPLNRHVKSIVNPRRVFNMIGCHEAARISGYSADSHGQPIRHNFRDREPQQDIIHINHYAVKSHEEFLQKQARGRASGTQKTLKADYFRQYDLNDEQD